MFRLLDEPRSVDDLAWWSKVVGPFTKVGGYTYFGNFFLFEPSTQQYAVLYTIEPELVPVDFFGHEVFRTRFLTDPGVIGHLGRPDDVAALEGRLGLLGPDQVFIPC